VREVCRLALRIHFVSLDRPAVHSPGIFVDFLYVILPVIGRLEVVSKGICLNSEIDIP
jgi:hypothetical protein